MIQELLEQLLNTRATSIWLTPSGKEEMLNAPEHSTDAMVRLAKLKGTKPDFRTYDRDLVEQDFYEFMKIAGYIRVYLSSFGDELDVSVGSKVTSAQLVKIGNLVREYPKFHWDIYNPWKKERSSKTGKGFREFVSALKSYGLFEARGYWRRWEEIACSKCSWRDYKKNFAKRKESLPKACPKCGVELKV